MIRTSSTILVFFATVATPAAAFASQAHPARPVTVSSPDGKVRAELSVANGILRYRVVVDGKQVLAPSMIGDYTPTVFTTSELMGNTWAHELAQAVVFTSPFLCFGGNPQSYLENPARDVLIAISPVWDETRVLSGSEPGKVVAEARRSGKQWFVAVINGSDATTLDIPLDFLGAASWQATQLRDAKDKPDAWDRQDGKVTRNDHIRLQIVARGGFVGWIHQ